jgi:hypothetical protein
MTDQNAIVSEGRDAWERIKGTRPLFSDWLAIGKPYLPADDHRVSEPFRVRINTLLIITGGYRG